MLWTSTCVESENVITNEDMAKTSTLTVRIAPELLDALKARAKRLGRSTSAEVVRMLSQQVAVAPRATKPARPSMGMFAQLEAPSLEEFSNSRKAVSKSLATSIRSAPKAP